MKFLLLFLSLNSFAIIETKDYETIFNKVDEVLKNYSPDRVLFVTDLDNTLLATSTDVASDQWVSHQVELIKNNPSSPLKLFDDFPTLLKAWHAVMGLQTMRKTEDYIPGKLKKLQEKGVHTMVLTSRAHVIREETMRELRKNNFDFQNKPFSANFRGHLEATGKTIDFKNGVAMTEGAHKGNALEYILKKLNKEYDVIFFIDDHKKHTVRVEDVFSKKATVYSYRYGKEDENVNAYKNSPKRISEAIKSLMDQYLKICTIHL